MRPFFRYLSLKIFRPGNSGKFSEHNVQYKSHFSFVKRVHESFQIGFGPDFWIDLREIANIVAVF